MLAARNVDVLIVGNESLLDDIKLLLLNAQATGNETHQWRVVMTDGYDCTDEFPGVEVRILDIDQEFPFVANEAFRIIAKDQIEAERAVLLLEPDCTIFRGGLVERYLEEINNFQMEFAACLIPAFNAKEGRYGAEEIWGWSINSGVGLWTVPALKSIRHQMTKTPLDDSRSWSLQVGRWLYPDRIIPSGFAKSFHCEGLESLDGQPRGIYLHHGCKDGSMQRLAIEQCLKPK